MKIILNRGEWWSLNPQYTIELIKKKSGLIKSDDFFQFIVYQSINSFGKFSGHIPKLKRFKEGYKIFQNEHEYDNDYGFNYKHCVVKNEIIYYIPLQVDDINLRKNIDLISVIEKIGIDEIDNLPVLQIVEIPDNVKWRLSRFDEGNEYIEIKDLKSGKWDNFLM